MRAHFSQCAFPTSFINIENTDSTAVALLKKLATVGGGMYKYVKSATALGAAMREMIVNEINLTKVEPEIGESFDIQYSFKNKNDAVLDNVGSLNDIYGLYYCRTKLAANTVLYINYTHVSDDDSGTSTIIPIPLYAYWNYGNGKVASFTSDIYGDWTNSFMNDNGKKLLQNAAYNTLPERNADHILTLNYVNNGVTSSLKASPNNGDVKGIVKATATYLGTDGVKADEDPLKDQIGVAREPMYLAFDGAYYSGEIATGVQGAKSSLNTTPIISGRIRMASFPSRIMKSQSMKWKHHSTSIIPRNMMSSITMPTMSYTRCLRQPTMAPILKMKSTIPSLLMRLASLPTSPR